MSRFYSTFSSSQNASGCKPTAEIVQVIKGDRFKTEIEKIRALVQQRNYEEACALKTQLKGFTPSGVFTASRSEEHLQDYSQVIFLDYDGLTQEDLERTYEQVVATPYTYMAFVNPDGNGLEVFVQVDSTKENHAMAFQQVASHYEVITGKKGKNVGEDLACFCPVSYDPDACLNEEASVFHVTLPEKRSLDSEKPDEGTESRILFEQLKKFITSKIPFSGESWNEHISQLASCCNRFGLSEEDVQKFVVNDPVYTEIGSEEKYDLVRAVFRDNQQEFGRFAYLADFAIPYFRTATVDSNELSQSPVIPEEIYKNLPQPLLDCCSILRNHREKDIAFLGAITVLSGCFPNVTGYYRGKMSASNLYLFITAPAANGKGILEEIRLLAQPIHKELEGQYKAKLKRYEEECRVARQPNSPAPERPPVTRLIFPANSSAAMIMTLLQDNGGQGIIFETEADTLFKTLKLEWGDFSDNLRKAFHHETMYSCRKADYKCIEVDNPKLSMVLSGTPAQVTRLFGSTENGLYSRFAFYGFDSDLKWESVVNGVNPVNYNEYYSVLGMKVKQLHDMYKKANVRFTLPDAFGEMMDIVFSKRLEDTNVYNEGAESVVRRLSLITYRIAMLLTVIRVGQECLAEEEGLPEAIECCEADFKIAMQLSSVLYSHSMLIFRALPHQSGNGFKIRDDKRGFISALPSKFKREEAIKLGEKHGLSKDVVDKLLKKLVKTGELMHVEFGFYQKASK